MLAKAYWSKVSASKGTGTGATGIARSACWPWRASLRCRPRGWTSGRGISPKITTEGLELFSLPVGTRLQIGGEVLLEISQIGKVCHTRCAIYYQAGDCVMPREGIFAVVLKGGAVKCGDEIDVLPPAAKETPA